MSDDGKQCPAAPPLTPSRSRPSGRRRSAAALAIAALVSLPATAHAGASAERIVSLNLCTDQILVDLVPRSRIRALSHLAADPSVSATATQAQGIPTTKGAAEDVIARDPDLVIAGTWTTPATVDLLKRLGRRLELVPLASDIAGIRAATLQIASAVGERQKGEEIVAAFDRRIASALAKARAAAADGLMPSALVYQVNGLASGPGSLADAALSLAGWRNHATTLRLGTGGQIALESLIASPPDLIVLSARPNEYQTPVADNLRHPLLDRFRARGRLMVLPWALWLCGTPAIAEAVERLADARARFAEARKRHP